MTFVVLSLQYGHNRRPLSTTPASGLQLYKNTKGGLTDLDERENMRISCEPIKEVKDEKLNQGSHNHRRIEGLFMETIQLKGTFY